MSANNLRSFDFYIERFEKAKSDASAFIEPVDERTFRRKPSSEAWCIGECFSHLVETGNKYHRQVDKGLDNVQELHNASADPMHLRFHMQWFVNYLKPPVSFKTKSPGVFKPSEYADLDKEKILNTYLELQDRFLQKLKYASENSIDLGKLKVSNPVVSWISMTVAECIAVTEAHQRRHLEQAKNTLKLVSEVS